jgi:putative solute:sodium symporter small subunit
MPAQDETADESTTAKSDGGAVQTANYLDTRINLFKPQTPFMRDHLKVVWGTFAVWVLIVFGPVTVAAIAPQAADAHRIAGTPTLFMMTAIGIPLGALLLSVFYAWRRDKLDEKYDIEHGEPEPEAADEGSATATDGGEGTEGSRSSSDEGSNGGDSR